jgi:hypothetical protein
MLTSDKMFPGVAVASTQIIEPYALQALNGHRPLEGVPPPLCDNSYEHGYACILMKIASQKAVKPCD